MSKRIVLVSFCFLMGLLAMFAMLLEDFTNDIFIGIATAAVIVAIRKGLPSLLYLFGVVAKAPSFNVYLLLAEGGITISSMSFTIYFLNALETYYVLSFVLVVVCLSLMSSYRFVVRPFFLDLYRELREPPHELKDWMQRTFDSKAKLKMHSGKLINAYAIGVAPASRTIVLGDSLLEKLDEKELKAVAAHEMGHLCMNHLSQTYMANILCMSAFGLSLYGLYQIPTGGAVSTVLAVSAIAIAAGGLGALLFSILPGILMKKLELEADQFAADTMGVDVYAHALKKIDALTNGRLSKGDPFHPSLEKRLGSLTPHATTQTERPAA